MQETIMQSLREWNKTHGERAKLQYAYFAAIILLIIIAGLASLLNVELGRQLLAFAALLGGVWLINAVAWSLLQSFVLSRLTAPRRATKATSKK